VENLQLPATVYFAWDGKVFAIAYDIDGQTFINYRTTFEMILNSLKLTGAPIVETPAATQPEGPGAFVPTTEAATGTATGTQP